MIGEKINIISCETGLICDLLRAIKILEIQALYTR